MPTSNLTDEERSAVAAVLRKLIAGLKFPYSPRLEPLKSALAKLDPPKPKAPPKPPIAGASDFDYKPLPQIVIPFVPQPEPPAVLKPVRPIGLAPCVDQNGRQFVPAIFPPCPATSGVNRTTTRSNTQHN